MHWKGRVTKVFTQPCFIASIRRDRQKDGKGVFVIKGKSFIGGMI